MKLIPYGSHWLDNPPPANDVYVFCGTKAWEKARGFQISRPGTLCLPPHESPFAYIWPVKGCDILVFETSPQHENFAPEMALCLIRFGANIVRFVNYGNKLSIYKRNF